MDDLNDGEPFALLYRPSVTGAGILEVFRGPVAEVAELAGLEDTDGRPTLALIPFRQVAERGYACHDDGTPLLAMRVENRVSLSVEDFVATTPDQDVRFEAAGFDLDDDTYAELVRNVLAEEIGTGAGANFVIKRSYSARLRDFSVATELALFRRLLLGEEGAHWTFLIHTGQRTFVGASPERHVSLEDGVATMNPISGTLRHSGTGPTLDGVLEFLADRKEVEELYMVVDEELKMMAGLCPDGVEVDGPYLRQMRHLTHTEYFVRGRTRQPPGEILRQTLLAPTVTGSPVENACAVVRRHERTGRGYYSGVAALLERDASGRSTVDSAILIRTAELSAAGELSLGVGATLVRHSDPVSEVAETRAKAAGFLSALRGEKRATAAAPAGSTEHPEVRRLLTARNAGLARFWLHRDREQDWLAPELAGLRALVVDNEDTFTAMLACQLRALGLGVTVAHWRDVPARHGFHVVIPGPGPGDPGDVDEPKIARLHALIEDLLDARKPFVAVCLSHQVLSRLLGLEIHRRPEPNQGVRHHIDLFGEPVDAGFYNTFAAHADTSHLLSARCAEPVRICRDEPTGEVHALSGPGFTSVQFHPESLLTEHGPTLLRNLVTTVLWPGVRIADRINRVSSAKE
ncbi:phenazine-specific anthranilate synthase component I [Amycolatopsis coloradensis]|uniref:anthranilate synthase n=1 Tax=Amycolatopsis coloradensis TaxID=76021 RepID=A0A1R0L0L5_9PSEU|nr:anthranilate synthase family protein [Amycolatopsis coloradensis]OLZ55335.1 phenazine-specific anthranilate synthase component I [Amycolatopsis coloradensis]